MSDIPLRLIHVMTSVPVDLVVVGSGDTASRRESLGPTGSAALRTPAVQY